MLEALLQISINGPAVSEAEDLVNQAVKTWSKTKKRKKLPPAVNLKLAATTSGNSKIQVQTILADIAIQTDLEEDVSEEAEAASLQAEVEAAVKAFKLSADQTSYESDDSAFESEEEY